MRFTVDWMLVVKWSRVCAILSMMFLIAMSSSCEYMPRAKRQIVLITIDTLRADHLGCYGYGESTSPQIDAFAKGSVLFQDVTSQAPWTTGSFASLMTGRTCSEALANKDQLNPNLSSLAELLRDEGFATVAVLANPKVHSQFGFARGFERYVELYLSSGPGSGEFHARRRGVSKVDAREVTDTVLGLLPELADRDFFLWVLYIDPHEPYRRLEDGFYPGGLQPALERIPVGREVNAGLLRDLRTPRAREDTSTRSQIERDFQDRIFALYDGEIRYVDQQIGRLLEGLERTGISNRSLIILTADHGESIYDHRSYFGHGRYPFQATVHVPLIIRWPGAPPGVVEAPAALVDLFPTVLEFARVEGPREMRGASLTPSGRTDPMPILVKTGTDECKRAFRKGAFKLIDWGAGKFSLFNVIKDTGETRDLSQIDKSRLQSLREELTRAVGTLEPAPTDLPAPEVSVQVKDQLRALGYLQ